MQNEPSNIDLRSISWRPLMALFFALGGQFLLEPPARGWIGITLYLVAVVFAVWSCLRGEWTLFTRNPDFSPLSQEIMRTEVRAPEDQRPRILPLLASLPLLGAAYYFFGGNQFTILNLSLWAAGMIFFIVALSSSRRPRRRVEDDPRAEDGAESMIKRLKSYLQKMDWEWFALLLAVFALAAFFRFYRLSEVPAEPFSDHAEKLLDVYDISNGQTSIFFIRNTGREGFQMYWTFLVSKIFGSGISFFSLKLGTALLGMFTLPFIYLLGKEFGNPLAGFFALFMFGIAYWPNVISRIGLRFPLYPLFAASTLLYLIRGLRTHSRNDFLLCGLSLGLGLHGYTPFRIMPFVILAAFAIFILHTRSKEIRLQALWWLTIVAATALMVFLPLLRYWLEHPDIFGLRALSRLGSTGAENIFFSNLWHALLMFNWDNGNIWVNSLPHRPALDVVTGAFFVIGLVLLMMRYASQRDWRDLFLLVSIPILLMPSVLSLAFPEENPALNRAGGAAVAAILVSALAVESLIAGAVHGAGSGKDLKKRRALFIYIVAGILFAVSSWQNYDLVFRQFDKNFRLGSWNSSEMGRLIKFFGDAYGQTDTVWIVPYTQWVDTRLPALWIGIPDRDFALWPDQFVSTLYLPAPKLILFNLQDVETENALKQLYPNGSLSRYTSATLGKDFMVFFVEK